MMTNAPSVQIPAGVQYQHLTFYSSAYRRLKITA